MSHPIHHANESSPYGHLTREQFYKKHQIIHQESSMLNTRNQTIFTQSWRPDHPPKALVAMVHGYISESSWLFELNAVAFAKAGFLVFALDLPGHGYSQGSPQYYVPDIEPLVNDCIQFFDAARNHHPKLPAFLYGESLGGAIAILICLRQRTEWRGLVLSGAMCGVSAKFKPMWPLEKLLPVAAYVAPKWRIVFVKSLTKMAYKGKWQRRVVGKSPNRRSSGKPQAATALELMRVCEYVKRNSRKLEVPVLVLHGEADAICDAKSARFVYESAASEDKTIRIFPGMWHQLIGESNEDVERVFEIVLSWIGERANKYKTCVV